MGGVINKIELPTADSNTITNEEVRQLAEQLGHNIFPINKLIINEHTKTEAIYTADQLKDILAENSIYLRQDKYMLIKVPGYQNLDFLGYNVVPVDGIGGYDLDCIYRYDEDSNYTQILLKILGYNEPERGVITENISANINISIYYNGE